MDPITLGIALAGGAAGNVIGKSEKVGGSTPWNKVLAPAAAILMPMLYKKFIGGGLSDDQVVEAGLAIGATAIGAYSAGKNLYQLVSGFFKKGK